jgi:hypothetical protein
MTYENLQQLVDGTTGAESVLGIILVHPKAGKAVLVEIDRRNNNCTLWFETQTPGDNGFRNVLYGLSEYKIASEFSFEKAKNAMELFLA